MPGKGRQRKKTRARYGTGSLKEPRPGYFELTVSLGTDRTGKRIRRTVTGRSPEEVEEKAAELKGQFRRGLIAAGEKITVAQHVDAWLRLKKRSLKSGTYTRYESHLAHVKAMLGKIELQKLTEDDVNALNEYLSEETDLSQRYIYDINCTLRSCLNAAVQPRGPLAYNAAKLAEAVPKGKKKVRFLIPEEVTEFLGAAKGERYESLFSLMLATGLRPGEALGLPWDAVDVDARILRVFQALHEEGGRLFIGPCKTNAAYRTLALSDDAIESLRRQKARWNALKLEAGPSWSPPVVESGYSPNLVFTTDTGGMVARSNVASRDLGRILKRVSLQRIGTKTGFTSYELVGHRPSLMWRGRLDPGEEIPLPNGETYTVTEGDIMARVNLHAFRHTFVSMLIFEGVDIKTISELIGHESVSFTYDVYGHLMPGSTERAARAIDKVMERLRR